MKTFKHVFLLVSLSLSTCCLNVIFLEAIIKRVPSAGNLITCSQFLFVSLEGFFFTTDCLRKKSSIPMKKYFFLVILFFSVNVSNNLSLNYKISVPLHIIFRSGSLLANLILGFFILNRRYSKQKVFSVSLISFGIILATLASSQPDHAPQDAPLDISFLIGLSLLTFALISSAILGIFQESLFLEFGKHPKEAVFYQHFLSLPAFLLLSPDILRQMSLFSNSNDSNILYILLLSNVFSQFACIHSVMSLLSECSSLTATLVLTLRKFLSLIISIFYFDNDFSAIHWFATTLVFAGSLLFLEVPLRRTSGHVITVSPRIKEKKSDSEDNS